MEKRKHQFFSCSYETSKHKTDDENQVAIVPSFGQPGGGVVNPFGRSGPSFRVKRVGRTDTHAITQLYVSLTVVSPAPQSPSPGRS